MFCYGNPILYPIFKELDIIYPWSIDLIVINES